MPERFRLIGKTGFLEAERFGSIYRVWEYESDNLQDDLEIQADDMVDFVLYWQDNGYPLLNAI